MVPKTPALVMARSTWKATLFCVRANGSSTLNRCTTTSLRNAAWCWMLKQSRRSPNTRASFDSKQKSCNRSVKENFQAFDAAVTTSRLGVPRYWLQSERLQLTDRKRLSTDPATGIQRLDSDPFIESSNNFVYFAGAPLLYWPTLATSLKQPSYYVTGIDVGSDSVFRDSSKVGF